MIVKSGLRTSQRFVGAGCAAFASLQCRFWALDATATAVRREERKSGMCGCCHWTERQMSATTSSQLVAVHPVELDSLFEP
ncbi:hypothetical protein V6N13_125537 [Hibiscus sabdariffa]|uniref:Secreted protein n=1 Tax=Hibiscus sabdariffa TaxID=183260 RepID=A0ABR2U653_9ROSI